MKIYCAHAFAGLSYDDIMEYYKETTKYLKDIGYEVLNPMTGKDALSSIQKFSKEGYDDYPLATNRAILGRDHWMCNQADIVYVNLLGTKNVSIGSCMELAFAYTNKKHTILVIEKDNIHRHAFTLQAADVIFETTEAAEEYLMRLSGR